MTDNHQSLRRELTLFFSGIGLFILSLILPISERHQQILAILALMVSGYHIIWEGLVDTYKETKANAWFTPNTHILMSLAALGAILLGEAREAALLIFIFAGAHFLEEYVQGRSQREISQLLALNPTEARRLKSDGQIELVSVDQLKLGDRVQVLNGDQVPADGVLLSGRSTIDESTISGESIPCEKEAGDEVFASTMNGNGSFVMEVTKESSETVFAKIIELVEASQINLAPTAARIRRFEPAYVSLVLLIFALLLIFGPITFGWTWSKAFATGLTFMVSASPCALAVSAIPSSLAAISNLARQGVLFKGSAYLSNLADLKLIAFDKTGTLTEGKPQLIAYQFEQDYLPQDQLLSLIVAMEKQSNHPLAEAIRTYFADFAEEIELEVENHPGQGLTASYQGLTFRLGKPSLFEKVTDSWLTIKEAAEHKGQTVIFLAINETVLGYLAVQDRPQKNAKTMIDYFSQQGVKTLMITGDAQLTGQAIGQELGLDQVFANVLPEEKASLLAEQQTKVGLTAMLGDGVNDAPALAIADIAIAMGEGTDVAIETADLVLMKNDLSKLVQAHKLSKKLKNNIRQNIVFSLLVVLLLVGLTFWGNLSVVASVSLHEGSTLLVLFNALRLLIRQTD